MGIFQVLVLKPVFPEKKVTCLYLENQGRLKILPLFSPLQL